MPEVTILDTNDVYLDTIYLMGNSEIGYAGTSYSTIYEFNNSNYNNLGSFYGSEDGGFSAVAYSHFTISASDESSVKSAIHLYGYNYNGEHTIVVDSISVSNNGLVSGTGYASLQAFVDEYGTECVAYICVDFYGTTSSITIDYWDISSSIVYVPSEDYNGMTFTTTAYHCSVEEWEAMAR